MQIVSILIISDNSEHSPHRRNISKSTINFSICRSVVHGCCVMVAWFWPVSSLRENGRALLLACSIFPPSVPQHQLLGSGHFNHNRCMLFACFPHSEYPMVATRFAQPTYAGASTVPGSTELGHSMPNFTASSMSSVRNIDASLLTWDIGGS